MGRLSVRPAMPRVHHINQFDTWGVALEVADAAARLFEKYNFAQLHAGRYDIYCTSCAVAQLFGAAATCLPIK